MAPVTIYTARVCPYCVAAKRLFDGKGVSYSEVDVTFDHDKRAWLFATTGQRTVPQIFIGGEPRGGYIEVAALERKGELDGLLEASSRSC